MNELAGTMTSSPGPMPSARSASDSASVPDDTPTAYALPQYAANSSSKASSSAPNVNAPWRATRATTSSSCSSRTGSA